MKVNYTALDGASTAFQLLYGRTLDERIPCEWPLTSLAAICLCNRSPPASRSMLRCGVGRTRACWWMPTGRCWAEGPAPPIRRCWLTMLRCQTGALQSSRQVRACHMLWSFHAFMERDAEDDCSTIGAFLAAHSPAPHPPPPAKNLATAGEGATCPPGVEFRRLVAFMVLTQDSSTQEPVNYPCSSLLWAVDEVTHRATSTRSGFANSPKINTSVDVIQCGWQFLLPSGRAHVLTTDGVASHVSDLVRIRCVTVCFEFAIQGAVSPPVQFARQGGSKLSGTCVGRSHIFVRPLTPLHPH